MAEIVLDRVSKRFGSVNVISDVSLKIAAGELVPRCVSNRVNDGIHAVPLCG